MPQQYQFAFWNLENLFDVENSPRRSEKLQRVIRRSLEGWTQALLDRKVSQLASIIRQMNAGRGPDLLGVCEVENEFVMTLLVQALGPLGRTYGVAHNDTPDERGIDVGFIYDANLFSKEEQFSHFVLRRTATRDLFQVNFRTLRGRALVVVGNHWPSRSGGELESAGYRAIAGETLAYFHERILEVLGATTPVLATGDFNDEPSDRSLVDYALSTGSRMKVINATEAPRFFNLMWPLMGQGLGSLYFDNWPNLLDQFLANKNLLESGAIKVVPETATVVRFPEMVAPGDYPKPVPFGGMGKPINQNGFSDHFPIAISIEEAD